ncbi:MAG: hypothetical protein H0T20_06420 [Actinobacteria bacterium]|nr:hypothetical protein [Actinomycetota bacterium]
MFAVAEAAVRGRELFGEGVPATRVLAPSAPESHTLGDSLLALRVGLPSTIAKRTVPEGVVATYVPSCSGRPERRPSKRKRFGPFRAGRSSRPADRQTGATCLSRITTRPEAGARKASTTVGRRFVVVGPNRPELRLSPLELCPPAAGVDGEPVAWLPTDG